MAIIKDKYGSRGTQVRPRHLRRQKNDVIQNPVNLGPNVITTEQRQKLDTEAYRANPANQSEIASSKFAAVEAPSIPMSIVRGFSFTEALVPELIFTLGRGETLNDIIIHCYHAARKDDTKITLYWSTGDQSDASFTTTSDAGAITVFEGITLIRFFGSEFTYLSTLSLRDIIDNVFVNVSQEIHFYGTTSATGPNITYSKTSG